MKQSLPFKISLKTGEKFWKMKKKVNLSGSDLRCNVAGGI
jgi:hypothetical protein